MGMIPLKLYNQYSRVPKNSYVSYYEYKITIMITIHIMILNMTIYYYGFSYVSPPFLNVPHLHRCFGSCLDLWDAVQLPVAVYVFKDVAVDLGTENAVPRDRESGIWCHTVSMYLCIFICMFFPTCQVRVTRFYQSDAGRGLLLLLLLLLLPPPPRRTPGASSSLAADRSGNCRTSSASSRSQWAPPDLNRECQIPVGNAGPQRRAQMEYQIECQIECPR